MFRGQNMVNYMFHDWNPFRNKFQRWCIKHKLIHKLDYSYIENDQSHELVGAAILYEGNVFLLAFLSFVTQYHFSGNYDYIRVKDGKIVG